MARTAIRDRIEHLLRGVTTTPSNGARRLPATQPSLEVNTRFIWRENSWNPDSKSLPALRNPRLMISQSLATFARRPFCGEDVAGGGGGVSTGAVAYCGTSAV